MPRHVKSKAIVGPKAVRRGRPREKGWCDIQHVAVHTTRLIEIGPDSSYWTGDCGKLYAPEPGDIVKISPPPGADESLVRAIERSFYDGGATSVKVMPIQEGDQITIEGETFDISDSDAERSLRQVVMERAARSTNSHDLEALNKLLIQAMNHAEAI